MDPPTAANPFDHLRAWIGRSERRSDTITVAPLAGLASHAGPRRRRRAVARLAGAAAGALAVSVRHEICDAQGVALSEAHDIVYREETNAGVAPPAPAMASTDEDFSRAIVPDPVLLFRHSALTFNGHRIHCDRATTRAHSRCRRVAELA